MKLKIEIKNRWSRKVLFEFETENNTTRTTLLEAIKSDASLRGANLGGANLSGAKNDLWVILIISNEVGFLLKSLNEGTVDGSCYEGDCCCLVGTIAKSKGCNFQSIPNLRPNSSRPAECWFLGIKKGDTPENSPVCKLTVEWVEEFKMHLQNRINDLQK